MFGNTQEGIPWRPIEHCCSKENKKLKSNTLIETNIQGELKHRGKKTKKYRQKVSELGLHFRKLKSRKIKGRKKEIYCPPREQEKIIKVKITSKRRKMQRRGNQREPRGGGDRNKTSSENNQCIQ